MAALVAGIAFGTAMGLLLAFFVTGNRTADRWSNVAFLIFYAAAALVAYDVGRRYGGQSLFVWLITAVSLSALAVLFISQLLVLIGAIDFRRVAIPQTIGFAVYILWVLAASVFALAFGGQTAVAWLGVAAVAVSLGVLLWLARDPAVIRGDRPLSRGQITLSVLPFLGITAWLIALGLA